MMIGSNTMFQKKDTMKEIIDIPSGTFDDKRQNHE